jgi:hypothetical protein
VSRFSYITTLGSYFSANELSPCAYNKFSFWRIKKLEMKQLRQLDNPFSKFFHEWFSIFPRNNGAVSIGKCVPKPEGLRCEMPAHVSWLLGRKLMIQQRWNNARTPFSLRRQKGVRPELKGLFQDPFRLCQEGKTEKME